MRERLHVVLARLRVHIPGGNGGPSWTMYVSSQAKQASYSYSKHDQPSTVTDRNAVSTINYCIPPLTKCIFTLDAPQLAHNLFGAHQFVSVSVGIVSLTY